MALSFRENKDVLFSIKYSAERTALSQDNCHAYLTSYISNEHLFKKPSIKKHLFVERCWIAFVEN